MKFVAYERTQQGTGASRRLRKTDKVPGIVYGAGTPQLIELDHNALFFALKKEAFHSSLLDMELAGKSQQVLLRDFQMHPWKPNVLHIDFQRVDASTRIHKKIPLHFEGEENSPAVKTDKCVVSHVTTDLSVLVKNQTLKASDLKLPEGIKWVKHGKIDPVIVAVTVPKEEVEEAAPAAPVVAAPAAPVKKKKDERQNKK
jgi:large subunit ribosomal protein L25